MFQMLAIVLQIEQHLPLGRQWSEAALLIVSENGLNDIFRLVDDLDQVEILG